MASRPRLYLARFSDGEVKEMATALRVTYGWRVKWPEPREGGDGELIRYMYGMTDTEARARKSASRYVSGAPVEIVLLEVKL